MTLFSKGQSGNPKGRPRKRKVMEPSAFDMIFDRTITVNQDGGSRDLSIEEGLQFKTYQAALAGSKTARREVLKMIARREQWLAKRRVPKGKAQTLIEHDTLNANPALRILGIVIPDERFWHESVYERQLMEQWAVEAAVKRMRRRRMHQRDIDYCRMFTRNSDQIDWPEVSD